MNSLLYSLLATLIVSLVSFSGALAIIFKQKVLDRILLWLVGFSAGALMGGAFLHLIPEAVEKFPADKLFLGVLGGFILFFILEKGLSWHHCHKHGGYTENCPTKTLGYMNLVGDGLHNFLDGLVIAASFVVDIRLGIVTTIAVLSHEVPQEISDFGVLLYSGFSKTKALIFNFISALIAVLGAFVGFFISGSAGFSVLLIAITAGGFIYISASDLIPEIHKERNLKKSVISLLFFLFGVAFMYWVKAFFE